MGSSIKRGGNPPTSIRGIQPEMAIAHQIVSEVYAEYGLHCVITSGTDSKHMNGSKHYTGYALDYRIRVFEYYESMKTYEEIVQEVCDEIQDRLGGEFDVINEFDRLHIHVEFDPTRPLNEKKD